MIDPGALADAGLRCERNDAVVTVTLNRPARRNAQTPAMWRALSDIGRSLPGDVRVVVVQGEGASFSSGLDLAAFPDPSGAPDGSGATGISVEQIAGLPESQALATIATYQRAFSWLTRPELISIAAVQGHAVGAGFQLMLACDLRIVADDVQLSMPEGQLGLVPDLGGTHPLVRTLGYSRALEICLTGRRVGAAEAHRSGLVNMVVPVAELADAVADCASAVQATPRAAAAELKALLRAAMGQSAEQQMASEREAQLRRLKDRFQMGD